MIVRKLDFEFTYRFWGTLNSKKFILENFRMSRCPSKSLNVFWKNFQQTCNLDQHMDARKYFAKVRKSTPMLVTQNQKWVFSTKTVYKDSFKFLYKIVMGPVRLSYKPYSTNVPSSYFYMKQFINNAVCLPIVSSSVESTDCDLTKFILSTLIYWLSLVFFFFQKE